MASAKMTVFFKDQTGFGWSENFFYAGPVTGPAFSFNLQNLFNARAAILTNTCTITHARIASGQKRNPTIVSIAGGAGKPGAETPPTAPSEVAILMRYNAAGFGYLRPFLRGIPERVVAADSYVPDPIFTANINALINVQTNGLWNAVGTLGGSPTQFPVQTLTPNLPRGYNFATPAGSAFVGTVGQLIRIHGTKVPGFSGLKTITQADNTNRRYAVGGASPAAVDNGAAPYLTVPGSYDATITDALIEGISRRGAGRPFGLSRGRKQTLYSLRQ